MKTWTFEVGAAAETGTLTWSGNGTLRQVTIVDGFNSGGSQTCTFGTSTVMGYDDLGRLLSDNCGSVWQQTFSYNDQYDNLTKSGSSAWNPGYNPANNHATGVGYDNSGNVTSDPSHTYKWDPFNKLQSVDSSSCASNGECVTYDALGRIVESSYNGVYTEIWYTQLGKTIYMHGSTPQYAYWPTPGGGTVEVNGNNVTSYYMHIDWLGNSRISSVIGNSQVVSDQAYAPYGEVYNKQAIAASTPAQMFTGDTQDVIGGIFDTPNRELNASQGRWLSPDPAGEGWNQYAYVTNPNSFTDPLGLGPGGPGGPTCLAARPMGQGGCNEGQTTYGGGAIDALSGWFSNFDQFLTNAFGTVGADGGYVSPGETLGPPIDSGNVGDPTTTTQSVCGSIPSGGRTIPVTSSSGQINFQFNGQGALIGLGVQLTGENGVQTPNMSVPANTFAGVTLTSTGTVQFGFNNPVKFGSGVSQAYFQTATFSSGKYSEVTGAWAPLGIPWGSTSGTSSILLSTLNGNSTLGSQAWNLGTTLTGLVKLVNNTLSCKSLFGGG